MKGPIIIDFLEKVAAVNSASYCYLLMQYSLYLMYDTYNIIIIIIIIYKRNFF